MLVKFYDVPWSRLFPLLRPLSLTAALLLILYSIILWFHHEEKKKFVTDAQSLIQYGLTKATSFRLIGDNGFKTVLSPKYASEISNIKALSFARVMTTELHSHIDGFSPFGQFETHVFQDAVRTKLTQALGTVTKPLAEETSLSLERRWTNNRDWHSLPLEHSVLDIVAQLSSRVFLGDKICRNPNWLRTTVDYTTNSFQAAEELSKWPSILQSFVAKFLESTRKVKQNLQTARDIIQPVLEERRICKEAARIEGRISLQYNDAMEWIEQTSRGRLYDPAAMQMILSVFSIHTTSDLLAQAIFDLCGREKLIHELREELITILPKEGWKKTSLNKLHLMDSFLKESQRLKPMHIVSLRRIAEEDIKLRDGTKIAKGTSLFVPTYWMWDSKFYENPEVFDPYRFINLRQLPGNETRSQLIVPTPQHMGFGLGSHACPGRFLAVNEIKIALCHILLKYDFRLPEGTVPKHRRHGTALQTDPHAEIMIRRRQEEIDLENILNIH